MRRWLESLNLPWANIPRRWKLTTVMADLAQRLVDTAGVAVREWWPSTCRDQTLPTWGRTLTLPRRAGESTDDHRRRLATWRTEPVGSRGWVRDEVERITGARRVIEFPRDGGRSGYVRCGHFRCGRGPLLVVGATAEQQPAVLAALEPAVPKDAAIRLHEPDVFDTIE